MIFGVIGAPEVVVILIIALLVFGPQKLPEIGRQVGAAYRELNRMRDEMTRSLELDSFISPYQASSYTSSIEPYTHSPYHDKVKAYSGGAENSTETNHLLPPPGPRVGPNVVLRTPDAESMASGQESSEE